MTTFAASRLSGPVRLARRASAFGAAAFFMLATFPMLAARLAHAQVSDPEVRPTRGPLITNAARAGDADATAVELNPGSLGLLPGASLELVAAGGTSASTLDSRTRRGAGL